MQVDAAILEVGLGGKFDATNAVCLTFFQLKCFCLNISLYLTSWITKEESYMKTLD